MFCTINFIPMNNISAARAMLWKEASPAEGELLIWDRDTGESFSDIREVILRLEQGMHIQTGWRLS